MNNQDELIAKYQELAESYKQEIPEPPKEGGMPALRRWYRDQVMSTNTLDEVLKVVETMVTECSDPAEDNRELIAPLRESLNRQRLRLNTVAKSLGLTAPEWD